MNEEVCLTNMTQEEKDEYVINQAMDIIMNSGDARSLASEAMDAIMDGDFDKARDLLEQADKVQAKAHNIQTDIIQGDIRGGDEKMGYYVLFAHAQDTLMTIQVEINLTKTALRFAEKLEGRLSALENR